VSLRLGVDVGGTFTDLVLFDPATNTIELAKTSSTPANQAVGVEDGIAKIARQRGVEASAIGFLAHGTTVATNALLERRGVPCGLLTTEGFRDVLHIGRQDRPKLYDWSARRPEPVVPRRLCFEVRERVLHTGEVLLPLDEAQAVEAIRAARAAGVTALAVCLLHAYANPAHERRLLELIQEHFPEAEVSLSSEVLPEYREYERLSTTIANAYVMPIVRRYVDALEERVGAIGIGAGVHIMQSNGGVMTARAAGRKSVQTMLSGPAAGVLGAVSLARQAGFENAITVDMGGTSFDICLAHGGEIRFTKESEVGSLPIKIPMIDIHTLGAGGGSIAWIDAGGALRVGPRSAGADPGPAGYGRGGTEPTVTDANLVLGRLDPGYFLGGEMALDVEAAGRAIRERIAEPLGLGVEPAAEGIVRVINATMVRGMRAVSVEKGYDPREFAVVAFGGGGPVHAADLARDFGAPDVLVPVAPGVTSALGLLMADFRYDFTATYLGSLSDPDCAALAGVYAELERQALEQMAHDGVAAAGVTLVRTAEVRYRRQGFELDVAVPGGDVDSAAVARVREAFHRLHARMYGYAMWDEEPVLVNAQVSAVARLPKPSFAPEPVGVDGAECAVKGRRAIYVDGAWSTATVYDRGRLGPGAEIAGPAIVEQADSTTVLGPGDRGRIDVFRNLIVAVG
jgi:N-methylhydantoinase A